MAIRINEDALFRAVTATGYKLLAYHLNLETGEVATRTLRPGEVAAEPAGPSVKPLPKLGGDLTPKKDALPFGPAPVSAAKKNLFSDGAQPKKPAFQGGFWTREGKNKPALFSEGFKRESGSKKLAEIFDSPAKAVPSPLVGEGRRERSERGVRGGGLPLTPPSPARGEGNSCEQAPEADPKQPRIPSANEEEQQRWRQSFARDCGDPEIREQLNHALKSAKPQPAFERVLGRHQRLSQQWERYHRKSALAYAEAWLAELGVEWELMGTADERR